ncbi:DUF262 domain-containing protein [Pseudanabaena sp. FACHB-2040]|uniref:DUF262 domain-containing protein n=1 Tax=Pseudanabaena sp. FACHB-2040 TaxID=2692859 RepID=UPI001684BFE4|nr:DUF262 domain-containing protein [Pseudanabaena sp. FACHB-2040]MBD2261191.1 DUF262 domain-containing protein [Pseudanabaena sp. FACHB-2040]
MPNRIHGAEYPIDRIFCGDFIFSIPLYQRPYAWEIEQAEALLDDLLSFLGDSTEPIDEVNPYFLGSIVLIKSDGLPEAEVVDGQQRLTTLTILLAALREVLPTEWASTITERLYQKGNPVDINPKGRENRYRLTLRERDAGFFKKYIQTEGGLEQLKALKDAVLPDSQAHIRDNALILLNRLTQISEQELCQLTQFLLYKCLLVVVSTPDMDSAYRIFSVLNDRGLDLSHSDILKSEIISKIPAAQQEYYNRRWEDTEAMLGRSTFQDLFSHIRMIYRKTKQKDSVLKEVREYVKPSENPIHFIDEVLCPTAQALADIQDCSYESHQHAEAINTYFKHLNQIDNADWLPSAIAFLSKYRHHPDKLLIFFRDLDRLVSGLMIQRTDINQRIRRYSALLTWIEENQNLSQPDSPMHLTAKECESIIQRLNGPLYLETKIRLYVLLRLDQYLAGGNAVYNFSRITVEHVLPQNPSPNSQWLEWFPDEEKRQEYVHCLGNLTLLPGHKNSSAQNYDFETKKNKYFSRQQKETAEGSVSPFAITTQVLNQPKWTPEAIEQRQKERLDCLKQLWRLNEPAVVS